MHFVKTEELKTGMRLARPIYNKKSILLFDRNSLLSVQAIESIRNFGLIGVYILEPAEPLPPLSREDLEFEQLQTVYIFRLREVLNCITERRKLEKYPVFHSKDRKTEQDPDDCGYGYPQLRTFG